MATRSLIGIKNKDGSISTIYTHWDGYPQYVGVQLALNYDEKAAKKLIKLGDRSSLYSKPIKEKDRGFEPAEVHAGFNQLEQYATRTDVEYVYIGEPVPGGFAWTAYSVEYGSAHDIAAGVIDKSLKKLGVIRPEVKFEAA